ncbi:MAG TPA: TerB family tellurite resistance protein [Polyangiaceae bacterium]|nr:TerB family tellurite resistance protein [Polyangiaceae bacterium]
MFGRFRKGAGPREPTGGERLEAAVRDALPEADSETIHVVTAMAGLLAAVAYADRTFSDEEVARVRHELGRIHGMTSAGLDAISAVLERHLVEFSTLEIPRCCRTLLDLADRELRVQILEALVTLGAADGSLSTSETNVLRLVTKGLGLSQHDYNEAQRHHRERIAAISPKNG